MISTSALEFDVTATTTDAVARPGSRRLALGRLLLGTSFVLGCVAAIMSALAANAPAYGSAPTHRDAMFVMVFAASILLAVVGFAGVICGLVAGRAGVHHAHRRA